MQRSCVLPCHFAVRLIIFLLQNAAVGVANNGHCKEATVAVQVAWLRHVACQLCLVLLQAGQLSQQHQLQLVDFCIKVTSQYPLPLCYATSATPLQ
jgi:hypothetical protein